MVLSLCTLLVVLMMGFFWPEIWQVEGSYVPYAMLLCGALVFCAVIFMHSLILSPLASLQRDFFPAVMMYLRRDRWIYGQWLFLFGFVLISLVGGMWVGFGHIAWIFPAWVVLFALALDMVHHSWNRLLNFLDPAYLILQLVSEAKKAIWIQNDPLFWSTIDNLTEAGLRGVEKNQLALSTQTLQNIPSVMQTFFDSSRNIARDNQDQQTKKETGKDEAGYTMFYLLQRLELINDKALQTNLEPLCRQMILTMSKLVVLGAKFDLSMVAFPTHLLTKFGLKAQQHHYHEVTVLTTSSLLEIAKTIVIDIDLTYLELQEPFRAIINGLAAIARKTFQRDKNADITLLTQPLAELRRYFSTTKMANHRDTMTIVQDIDNVLDEFRALEDTLRTLPPIASATELRKNSVTSDAVEADV